MNISELYKLYLQHPSVQTDTRRLAEGDIYFALKGPNFNGNAFAQKAIEAGASYAVVDEKQYATDDRFILVEDALAALQELAAYHRGQFDIPFIGITGSNGKTTTKELVTVVLRMKFVTYATEGNLNNHIGVPLTILKIKKDAQMAVIEMGANHIGEIASYCKIAKPTHAVITNCGKAHIEGFGSIKGVRKAKGELYDYIRENGGEILRNADLEYLIKMSEGIHNQVTYGMANATYIGRPVMEGVFLNVAVLNAGKEALIPTHLVGEYNFPNVMVAVAAGLHFGISINEVREAIENYMPDNSRSQWLKKGSNQIILDAYNANPTSMRAAIINFANADVPAKMLWIGGMKEMGQAEHAEHKELVELISKYKWAQVILVGKEFEGISEEYSWYATSGEAANAIKANPPQNSSILIKGSRGSKMETMLEAI